MGAAIMGYKLVTITNYLTTGWIPRILMIFHAIPSIFPVYSHWNALFRQGISTDFPRLARLCSCSGETTGNAACCFNSWAPPHWGASQRARKEDKEDLDFATSGATWGVKHQKKTIQNSSKHGDFTFVKNDFNDFFQKDGGYEQSDVIGDICIIGNWYHPTMRVCPKIGYPKKYSATLRDQQDNASNISHKKQSKKRFRPYISTHTENSSIHFLKPTDVRPSRALSASLNLRKA